MKGGLAAFAVALTTLRSTGGLESGAVTVLVDVDEETGSEQGLLPYIATHGLAEYDWAICGEPTGLRPYLSNRGLIWATVRVNGRAAHAGMSEIGVNPIPALCELIASLPSPVFDSGPYGARGPSLNATMLRAGQSRNSIPDFAEVVLDRRVVPGEDPSEIVRQLHTRAAEVTASSGLDAACTVSKMWPPCLLEEDSELALVARRLTAAAGYDPTPGFDDACNDASFTHAAGVPTLIWGPALRNWRTPPTRSSLSPTCRVRTISTYRQSVNSPADTADPCKPGSREPQQRPLHRTIARAAGCGSQLLDSSSEPIAPTTIAP